MIEVYENEDKKSKKGLAIFYYSTLKQWTYLNWLQNILDRGLTPEFEKLLKFKQRLAEFNPESAHENENHNMQ